MKPIITKAKAFCGKMATISATVAADGTVRVYDPVAGHYTTCHSLSATAKRRIRKIAAKA